MTRNFTVKAVHKKMYPATYNFRDEVDGTSGIDIEFVTGDLSDTNGFVDVIASWQDHNKILKGHVVGGDRYRVYHTHTATANPTYEFWIGTDNLAKSQWFYITNSGSSLAGANIVCAVGFNGSDLRALHGDGGGGNTTTILDADPAINTFYHIRLDVGCATDTINVYLHGVKIVTSEPFYDDQMFDTVDTITLYGATASDTYNTYWDAIALSFDTDYKIGDNVFWRHYGESTDDFESDDVGTQGTSITWVDSVDTAASSELVQEFNEHKKILRLYYSSGAGGNDVAIHNLGTQNRNSWFEWWWKVSDVTVNNYIYFIENGVATIMSLDITASKFRYRDDGDVWQDVGLAAINDTWYHCYLRIADAANDTFKLWIDNVLYKNAIQCRNNQTSGIDQWFVYGLSATEYNYVDAPISSLDSDERADNRIFDYNDAYTREDITTDTQNVLYSNVLHQWREATLLSNQDYEQTVLFFQIYDINSKLALEAEISNRVQNGQTRAYTLLDKNQDDLLNLSSNTFSADDIHDPTDPTCMLKTVLPNLSELDGDLILVNAVTKTDTYSTVTKNYPDGDFLRDISDLSDSVVIVEANGKCHLDDDLASGDSLDFDNAADHALMLADPIVNDILDTINYFEVFGAINPDTGERFFKITDNSGTDRKRKWRITNNSFRTQTDVDAYAAKLVAKLVSVKEITIAIQGLGAHNMGTTFTYKFVNNDYNIPSAAYYVIKETMDFDTAAASIVLSEGLVETSKYSAGFEKPQNFSDTYASEIYETDINTVYPQVSTTGAAQTDGKFVLTNGESVFITFYIPTTIDSSRPISIHISALRVDAGADTITCSKFLARIPCDNTSDQSLIWNNIAHTWLGTTQNREEAMELTISASDVYEDNRYQFGYTINEAGKELNVYNVVIQYYIKRSV